jgi:peptide/nickel transport system substrate-binding protein
LTDRRRRSAWLVALLLVLALVAGACGGDDDDTTAEPDQGDSSGRVSDDGGTPVPGGTLVFGQESDVATLDVAKNLAQPADRNISLAVYDTLMTYNDDGKLEPFLAEGIDATDDLTSYTLTLRSGVVFHDDTPLNADAVIAHFDRLKDPATASTWKTDADAIASMEKVDDLTVKFTMTGPNVGFPDLLAGTVGLIESPTAVQKEGADFGQRPVGTGPFELTEFIPGDRVVVQKNPNYWRKDADGNQLPYLDRIVFRPIPDTKQRINALRAGDVDMIQTADASTIKQGEDAGMKVQKISGSSSTIVLFNAQRAPVDDVRVRRALAYAMDKEAINDVVWDGTRRVANSAFSTDSSYYVKQADSPTYDPDEAKKLLADYGKPVSVTLECINTPESQQVLQLVEQMWEAVGVDVKLIFTEQGQFVNKIFGSKDYVTACFRSNHFADPDQLYTSLKTGSPANVLNYSNPEMDAALEAGRSTADVAERKKAYTEVQKILAETVPSISLAYDLFSNIYKPEVHGLPVPEAKSLGAIKTATIWIEK